MPNLMSDEDLALESGDARTCEHCGTVYWVDEWHTCAQGTASARAENEQFTRNFFGDGTIVRREYRLIVECPDTDMALRDVLSEVSAWYEPGLVESGEDGLLQLKWSITEVGKAKAHKPCGGCGNDDPRKRCIGCSHVF